MFHIPSREDFRAAAPACNFSTAVATPCFRNFWIFKSMQLLKLIIF